MPTDRISDAAAPSFPPSDDAQRIAQQAAAWVVAQDGPQWPQHRAAFEQWLQASPLHRTAYERARSTWQLASGLRQTPELLAQLGADAVDDGDGAAIPAAPQ